MLNTVIKFIMAMGHPCCVLIVSTEFMKKNPKKVEKLKPTAKQESFGSTALGEAATASKKYVSPNYSYKKLPFLRRTKGTDISNGM